MKPNTWQQAVPLESEISATLADSFEVMLDLMKHYSILVAYWLMDEQHSIYF